MSAERSILHTIRALLEAEPMDRYQDPKIELREDVKRPYYQIRPYVKEIGGDGYKRIRKVIRLGYADETTMRQAQKRKQDHMATVNQGKLVLQAQIPFSELVKRYREARLPKLGAATQKKYATHIENHILPVFGKAKLADIDRQSIEAWLNREAGPHSHGADASAVMASKTPSRMGAEKGSGKYSGLGWWALNDLRNILSAIFTAAIDWGLWTAENPCARVKLSQKTEKRERRIPNAQDLQRFLAAFPETAVMPSASARLVVLSAVVSGLRVSEVLGLAPEDIDVKNGTLRVVRRWHRGEFGPTKSQASRRVRQIGPLAQDLADLGRGKRYVFQRGTLPPDDRDLQQHVFRPAAEAVGIYFPGFGMHTFRRLNITWRQEVGATPFEAQKCAGHARPDTTWLYTITDAEREKQHVQAIFDRLIPTEGRPQ